MTIVVTPHTASASHASSCDRSRRGRVGILIKDTAVLPAHCPFDHDRIWIRFFGRLGTARHFSRPTFCSGTRCAHQFWPQCAHSAASAGARLAAGPAAGQAARARARIQPKSTRASSQISEFRSCMHSVSWIHARAGGWVAAHAMVWARLPGRGGPLNTAVAVRNLLSANSSARTG